MGWTRRNYRHDYTVFDMYVRCRVRVRSIAVSEPIWRLGSVRVSGAQVLASRLESSCNVTSTSAA